MEDNKEIVVDDLKTPSITQETPKLFSLKNIFKPTSKNMIILGMSLKIMGVGIVTLSTAVIPMAALITTSTIIIIKYGIIMNVFGILAGGLGEALILFTKEEPLSSLVRAAEDIQLTKQEDKIQISHDSEQS